MFDDLEKFIRQILNQEGFELIELVLRGIDSSRIIECYVDRDGGITAGDCAQINRNISDRIRMKYSDVDPDSFRLIVSSPGIGRPLKTEKDFSRNEGKRVNLEYLSEGNKLCLDGIIVRSHEDSVDIKTGNKIVNIILSSIQKAKIKIKW